MHKKSITKILFFSLTALIGVALSHAKIKVACVGDSITQGTGTGSMSLAYPKQLQNLLGEDYEVGNFGSSGATLSTECVDAYIKRSMYKKSLEFMPDIVVIKLGTNDSRPEVWDRYGKNFYANLGVLVDSFANLKTKPQIFLCYPSYAPDVANWGTREKVMRNEMSVVIDKFAKDRNLKIIDTYTPLKNDNKLFDDNLHPNSVGAYKLAAAVYGGITGKKALDKPSQVEFPPLKWNGYKFYEFDYAKNPIKVIVPHLPKQGQLWMLSSVPFGNLNDVYLKLAECGYYVVNYDITLEYGTAEEDKLGYRFFRQITVVRPMSSKPIALAYGLSAQAVLNWASNYPDNVAGIYLVSPVLDTKSLSQNIAEELRIFHGIKNLSDIKPFGLDALKSLAKRNVPIYVLTSENDNSIPFDSNAALFIKKYESLGGSVKAIKKPKSTYKLSDLTDSSSLLEFVGDNLKD